MMILVDEVEHRDRGDELGDGEEELVKELVEEVVVVIVDVRPPVKWNFIMSTWVYVGSNT